MARRSRIDLVTIDAARINEVCQIYFEWKDLDSRLRRVITRGLNFPESLSEPMACYALGLDWNKGSAGDAVTLTGEHIEMKATSNFNKDLTSFSPNTTFDNLYFLRLDRGQNLLYIYNLEMNGYELGDVPVSGTETVRDQQHQGRRPRFSVITTIINPRNLEPELIFDIRTMNVIVP